MKFLNQENQQQRFDSELLEDLSFIKERLRYPYRRMTVMPLLAAGVFVAILFRLLFAVVLMKGSGLLRAVIFIPLVGIPAFIGIKRYFNLIRFFPVATPLYIAGNIQLLQRFLEEQRLVTFRHPEAPEIFQIISTNIDAFGDEREVLIFICDDKRILINSHFTSSRQRFRFFIATSHQQEMIRQLRSWLKKELSKSSTQVAERW
jgi:hypothetical protein